MQVRGWNRAGAETGSRALAVFLVSCVGLGSSVVANRLEFLAWTAVALLVVCWALRPGRGPTEPRSLLCFALTAVLWFLGTRGHHEALSSGGRAMGVPDVVVRGLASPLPMVLGVALALCAGVAWWAQNRGRSNRQAEG